MTTLTHRAKRRARALALQIYSAGKWHFDPKSSDELYFFATRKEVAKKIIEGQRTKLKLTDEIIQEALRMVTLI